MRLRNIQLGYRFSDPKILSQLHLTAINVYARATNIWTKTFSDIILSDPEQGITGNNGQQVLPTKSITFGLSVSF